MSRIADVLFGRVRLKVTGGRPERVLNLLAGNGIEFSDVKRHDEISISFCVHRRDVEKAKRIAGHAYCETEKLSEKGLPATARKLKRRYALYCMPFICVMAALCLSMFIWDIDIEGNVTVPDSEILAALESQGIHTGSFGLNINRQKMRSEILSIIPRLEWITVNVNGCRAKVIVRERIEPPEVIDVDSPASIIAAKTGLITQMNVFSGVPMATAGETVLQGQTLISGRRDSKSGRVRWVHALGDIKARTWYEFSEKIPLEYISKSYTGKTKSKKTIIIGNLHINLYLNGGIPLDSCDKITYRKRSSLFGKMLLPVETVTREYRQYTAQKCIMDAGEAEQLLKDRLNEKLKDMIDGEILSTDFETQNDGKFVTVTIHAECLENIVKTIDITPENNTEGEVTE